MKTCLDCKEQKPLEDFYRRKTAKDGRQSRCKSCEKERCAQYYVQNKSRLLDKRYEHYENNKEATKAKVAEYRRKNPDKVKADKKAYEERNREVLQLVQRRRRKKFPARELLKSAKRRAKDRDVEFNLTEDDIQVPKLCPVFGYQLVVNEGAAKYNSPSLQLIDKTKGYTPDNIRVVSRSALFRT